MLTAVGTDRSGIMTEFGISSEEELDAHLEHARKVRTLLVAANPVMVDFA